MEYGIMKRKIHQLVSLVSVLCAFTSSLQAQPQGAAEAKMTAEVDKPGHTISPVLFGIFFEDINLSADGGIYPELIRNRSFEDADTLQNWKFVSADGKSTASISTADVQARPPVPPLNAFNRKSLCVKANGSLKLKNNGYWGMNIVKGSSYLFRLAARSTEGFIAALNIRIVGSEGKELASGEIKGFDAGWKYYSVILTASGSDPKAHLEISGEGSGKLYLDIEYANGPENSLWGSLRAKNGHPKPFNLKYLEIGNENGQAPYAERWLLFTKAIREKYPEIKLIANEWAGSHPQEPMPEIVDEHYYSNPDWFIWNANKYDSYDRKGPKIFVGEYAVTQNTGNGNLRGAIEEAAWMTGMERNKERIKFR
jgi:hypothetical protein